VIAVDSNVLVYAHREESSFHAQALRWLSHLAEDPAPWGLPVFALGEFVRVVTHPRLFDPPSSLEKALDAIEQLLKSPSVLVLNPGPRYPNLFARLARTGDARGNLAFDAQIAAVCLEHGASRLLTLDRDFARFAEIEALSVQAPLRG
jgi:toxin-antitoxin system PIN domain toxin